MLARQYAGYNSMLHMICYLDTGSGAVIAKRYGSVTVDNFLMFLQVAALAVAHQRVDNTGSSAFPSHVASGK